MTTQFKALRLADALENKLGGASDDEIQEAAAELRRLYAENEAAHAVGIRQEREMMGYEALLRQALEALEWYSQNYWRPEATEQTIAAIRERLGETQ